MTSPATRARRATTSRAETGFTLVELLVTMAVMSIVATAVMAVAMRTFSTTSTITNRRDVLADARIAMDRLTKQLRQGAQLDQQTPSTVSFTGYIDGRLGTIEWTVTGTKAPYTLEYSTNGGANLVPVVTSLADSAIFTYTTHGSVVDQVTVRLPLQTSTTTVVMTTDVQLRNVQEDS